MPFRSNAFGEQIAQPGTTMDEIEFATANRQYFDDLELHSADLYLNGDDEFKFGGTLYFTITIHSDEIDEETGEPDEPDYHDYSMEFDGFDTAADAKDFVVSLGLTNRDITEVN